MLDRQSAKLTKPRVLLVLNEASRTGAPILARDIFRALRDETVVRSIAWDGGSLEDDFRRLGPLTVLSTYPHFLPRPREGREAVMAAKAVGRARIPIERWRLRRWRPDVVYANTVWSLPLVARLGLTWWPVLLHVHELTVALAEFETAHPGLLRRIPSQYIAVSEAVAAALQHEYQVPGPSISVIRPFVAMPEGQKTERSPEGPFVVGAMGNPSWTKGGVLWLLAAREIVDRLGEGAVRFRWVGVRENEQGRQFRAMVDRLGLASSVELLPETRTPLMELASFDVLALTSWEEAAPLVVLESMGLAVPVVAFRGAGGHEEALSDGGVLIDGFSPTAMAAAIVDLARDPERRRALGIAGRERASYLNDPDLTTSLVIQQVLALRRSHS